MFASPCASCTWIMICFGGPACVPISAQLGGVVVEGFSGVGGGGCGAQSTEQVVLFWFVTSSPMSHDWPLQELPKLWSFCVIP